MRFPYFLGLPLLPLCNKRWKQIEGGISSDLTDYGDCASYKIEQQRPFHVPCVQKKPDRSAFWNLTKDGPHEKTRRIQL
jgi:hypothetical protein